MTEQDKTDALKVGQIISMVACSCPEMFQDEQRLVKAIHTYFKNATVFDEVSQLLMHGVDGYYGGGDSCEKKLKEALALSNTGTIPKWACDSLKKDIQELEFRRLNPPQKENASSCPTSIYLMKNHRNGFIKIGCSKNPSKRESTLQSQEPEVEMIASWDGTVGDETALHEMFKSTRVRGEWFKLTNQDIKMIRCFMEGKI